MKCQCKVCGKLFWSMRKRAEHVAKAHPHLQSAPASLPVKPAPPRDEDGMLGDVAIAAVLLSGDKPVLQKEPPTAIEPGGGESGGAGASAIIPEPELDVGGGPDSAIASDIATSDITVDVPDAFTGT